MAVSAKTEILTVRIEPRLLKILRKRARVGGRSVSAEVVRVLQADVEENEPRRTIAPITGWLSAETPPETSEGLRELRQAASRRLSKAITAKARRR